MAGIPVQQRCYFRSRCVSQLGHRGMGQPSSFDDLYNLIVEVDPEIYLYGVLIGEVEETGEFLTGSSSW